MGRITQELLRKRAEHNDGILSTLEEISLHQENIERIENLEFYCRHIKILYLQDNIIEKLENLDKLKELEYLNLAVNSIQKIENLEKCESLNKLDLTMNFVDIENLKESCDCLSKVPSLREIYLTGNPCEKFKYCRDYIIGRCPQIIIYDGNEVKKSERIKAREMMDFMEKELEKESKQHVIFKQNDPSEKDPNKYSVEYRRKLYKELEQEKLENERKKKEESSKPGLWDEPVIKEVPPPVYKENGEVRICNQGRYDVFLDEDIYTTAITTFRIKLPKFLDTNKIKVDLNPNYVRCDINGKITQWRFDNDIIVEKATVQRSTTTGVLEIKAPMAYIKPKEDKIKKIEENKKAMEMQKKEEERLKKLKPIKQGVDFVRDNNEIKEVESIDNKKNLDEISKECGVDLDEVPDLDKNI
jgi:protein TilB